MSSSEFYYTKMLDNPTNHVWALTIAKEAQTYELLAVTDIPSYYRFVAMPTFLHILQGCTGFKQYAVEPKI